MKSYTWKLAGSILWGLALASLIALFIYLAYGEVRDRMRLGGHGVTVQGTLELATAHKTNFIPTGYSFTVQYLNQKREFDVSRNLFFRYVENDKFTHHAPIKVVYLPHDESVAIPSEMLSVWVYWGSIIYFFGFAAILGYALLHCKKMINTYRLRQAAPSVENGCREERQIP